MKRQLLIIGFILITSSLFAQRNADCEEILHKEITMNHFQEQVDEFMKDFQTLVYCEFDSIDYQIFMGPQGNMPMIAKSILDHGAKTIENDEKFTFADLKEVLIELKQDTMYPKIRRIVEARNLIVQRNALLKNWSQDKKLLVDMGFTENHIKDIYAIVEDNESKPYPEIFLIYSDFIANQQVSNGSAEEINDSNLENENPEMIEWAKGLYAYQDYQLGLKKSKELDKPSLVYFNAYGCINSRMMDGEVLLNKDIQEYINQNLVFISLIVDERTKLEKNECYYSETLKKKVIYTGQINAELQIEKFNANSQPLFILLDVNGKEIDRIGYIKDIEKFKVFLEKTKK